jgi:hypothetical protein
VTFSAEFPATSSHFASFPGQHSFLKGDTQNGRAFKKLVDYLGSCNRGALEVLLKGPEFYDGIYESADFGYGLDFAYWLWKDDNRSYLLTTESYNSAGSSGVYAGRICIFRDVSTRVAAAADMDRRCSLADWHQDYTKDAGGAGGHIFGEIERGVYGVGGATRSAPSWSPVRACSPRSFGFQN